MSSYQKMSAAITVLFISQCFLVFGQDALPPYLINSDTTLEFKLTTAEYQILPDKAGKLIIGAAFCVRVWEPVEAGNNNGLY